MNLRRLTVHQIVIHGRRSSRNGALAEGKSECGPDAGEYQQKLERHDRYFVTMLQLSRIPSWGEDFPCYIQALNTKRTSIKAKGEPREEGEYSGARDSLPIYSFHHQTVTAENQTDLE